MQEAFRAREFTRGLVEGTGLIGELLAQHFPPEADAGNELPDDIVERPWNGRLDASMCGGWRRRVPVLGDRREPFGLGLEEREGIRGLGRLWLSDVVRVRNDDHRMDTFRFWIFGKNAGL